MANKVLKSFTDKESKELYKKGDSYENSNSERIAFLIEKGFIDEIEQTDGSQFPKHTGGAWYELSNGEKIQGKDEATAAEKELAEDE